MRYTPEYLADLDAALSCVETDCLQGASILITGASGLIGSTVADVLLRLSVDLGLPVTIVLAGRNREGIVARFSRWPGHFTFVPFDATTPFASTDAYDFIIHCAGNAHPQAYATQPVETVLGSIFGTNQLLRHCVDYPATRFLYVSSSEVYGLGGAEGPLRESDYGTVNPLSARSCYPNAKRLCETLCASYADEYGVDFVAVRPGHVYGPMFTDTDSRAHTQFARSAAAGRDIVMKSTGEQVRSYCYATDCASAILCVLLRGESGAAYNVGSPLIEASVRDLAQAFAVAGGVSLRMELPSAQEAKGYNPMPSSVLDGSALQELGWEPRVDVARGAAKTVACLRGGKGAL